MVYKIKQINSRSCQGLLALKANLRVWKKVIALLEKKPRKTLNSVY